MAKTNRIEVRIDHGLNQALENYCKKHDKGQSAVIREALNLFLKGDIRDLFLSYTHESSFNKIFRDFIQQSPKEIRQYFEDVLGPEEEHLIEDLPPKMLGRLNIPLLTARGEKALEKRKSKQL